MAEVRIVDAGWGWPLNSRKAHYFVDGRSLCMKWLFFGSVKRDENPSTTPGPDDCMVCHRAACKRRATK